MEILRNFEYGLSLAALILLVLYYFYLYRKTQGGPVEHRAWPGKAHPRFVGKIRDARWQRHTGGADFA